MQIKEKRVLITGAGGGMGRALTIEFLKRKNKVIGVDLKKESLESLAKDLKDLSKNFEYYPLDITDQKAVEDLAKKLSENKKEIDILINNAGIIQPFLKLNDLSYEAINRVMNVNFYGTLYMIKAFLPQLLTKKEGYIVNVSSMGGFLPFPGQGVYGASKAAVKLLTESLWGELVNRNIHVMVVFPGATNTNIAQNSGVKTPSQEESKSNLYINSPENVAKEIIKGIEKNKIQVFTGRDSKMMNLLYRLKPTFAIKFITKQMSSLLKDNSKNKSN